MKIEIRTGGSGRPGDYTVFLDGADISRYVAAVKFLADANGKEPPAVELTLLPGMVYIGADDALVQLREAGMRAYSDSPPGRQVGA